MTNLSPWLNVPAAAEHAGVSVSTIYAAAESGRLSGVKVNPAKKRSAWRFTPADVDRWLEKGRVRAA